MIIAIMQNVLQMDNLFENIYAECFHPIKLKVFDTVEQAYVYKEIPCGKCYHCKITKVNEWVTRMVLQSLYSKYVYFGTLTYGVTDTELFSETAPCLSKINKERKLLPTPILLRKDHLQKFFKRLRKNTGAKFQYFACGEYGGTYGRPHFHYIMWSDKPISESSVSYSWSTTDKKGNRVLIGRIDHQDMRTDAVNIEHSYKYVCKYLQKTNFDFETLPTKELHEKYIKENYIGIPCTKDCYFEHKKQYIAIYRPFVVCSKRPAIGYGYLQDNIDKFAQGTFKLFGVKGNYVFPIYYVRKTKEYICPYKTISTKNGKPNSYSNIPSVATLLLELQNAMEFNEGFLSNSPLVQFNMREDRVRFPSKYGKSNGYLDLPCKYFNFYDCKNKYYYYLRGDGNYDVCAKRYHKLYTITAKELIQELRTTYNNLLHDILQYMHDCSKIRKQDKMQRIELKYKDYNEYLSDRSKVIENLLSIIDQKQHKYQQTKTEF